MAIIHLTSEEFSERIEEMLDLTDKGDKLFIHHEGKLYTVVPVSDAKLTELKKAKEQ